MLLLQNPVKLSRQEMGDILTPMKILSMLSAPQIARLTRLKSAYWEPDELLLSEGDEIVGHMFILLSGSVGIRKRVRYGKVEIEEQVGEIKAPALIGEDSFFTGYKRSASVCAKGEVHGITIDKEEFNRILCLDKLASIKFIHQIADDSQVRTEKTLTLYRGMLRLIFNRNRLDKGSFYDQVIDNRAALYKNEGDIDDWMETTREILMVRRELNNALSELYHFANLPDIKAISVDKMEFHLSKEHRFYDIMNDLVDDLMIAQKHVELKSINLKEALASVVLRQKHDDTMVDYRTVVTFLNEAYHETMVRKAEMGIEATNIGDSPGLTPRSAREKSFLWDQV